MSTAVTPHMARGQGANELERRGRHSWRCQTEAAKSDSGVGFRPKMSNIVICAFRIVAVGTCPPNPLKRGDYSAAAAGGRVPPRPSRLLPEAAANTDLKGNELSDWDRLIRDELI